MGKERAEGNYMVRGTEVGSVSIRLERSGYRGIGGQGSSEGTPRAQARSSNLP